ncbi:MAG: C-terminal binding protein [Synergistaceae bacterium]|nr:C-terminal binding protein [Synergistaceae bacterium]
MAIHVIRTYNGSGDLSIEKEILGPEYHLEEIVCLTEDELIEKCKKADAIICGYQPLTSRVLIELENLKLIAFKAIGFNSVDIPSSQALGKTVTNIRNYCINEVADHTLALLLALNRGIVPHNNQVKFNKKWNYNFVPDISRLGTLKVGLLGFGNIPRLVAKRLNGFGPEILAYDPFVDEKTMAQYGVKKVELDDLYQSADYISIHLPLNESTHHMLNDKAFEKMKAGVKIINTGRGPIIDEAALARALDRGQVSAAALDVLDDELGSIKDNPLLDREDLILTPHSAFYSNSSMEDGRREVSENIKNYFEGNYHLCNIVNGIYPNKNNKKELL